MEGLAIRQVAGDGLRAGRDQGAGREGDGSRTRMRTSLPFASRSRAMRPPNVPVAPTIRIMVYLRCL